MKHWLGGVRGLWLLAGLCAGASPGLADVITIAGGVTQSTPDGTGPAANNSSINNILDGQAYTIALTFAASITAPGTYDLTGSSLLFSVPGAPASESSFDSITLVIANFGPLDDITLRGCLTTGTACDQGNQLSAIFEIPAASLNAATSATGLDQPHPLDLLEDDGVTDIQGSIAAYSYTRSASAVPEPASAFLLACLLAAGLGAHRRYARRKHVDNRENNI
ncbi:MAG TPA: hypothetical protein VMH80_28955 [Bryobacteraceae bacterium]|nr:hypothetical protein [Bryobacteraceae bacterium]